MSKLVALQEYLKGSAPIPTAKTAAVAAAPVAAPAAKVASDDKDKDDKKKDEDKKKDDGKKDDGAPAAAPAGLPFIPKTAAQKWAYEAGFGQLTEKGAEYVYKDAQAKHAAAAEQQKTAAIDELKARGAVQMHGAMVEGVAWKLAHRTTDAAEVIATALTTGTPVGQILKRAEEIRKIAQLAAASPEAALVRGYLGEGADVGSSEVLAKADQNGATTMYEAEGSAGTRQPTRGVDGKLLRFQEAATMPGNPGLNHGQPVDQGKGA